MFSRLGSLFYNRFVSDGPFFVVFHVTSRCNAQCQFCFNWDNVAAWQERRSSELSLEEIIEMTKKMGPVYQLTIGGGEPFLRSDLPEILEAFRENCGVRDVSIPTNAVLTARVISMVEATVSSLPDLHQRIGLSTPEIFENLDDIYQVKNSFKKHQETYQQLVELGKKYNNLTLSTALCCNKYNSGRIKDILDYIHQEMPEAKAHVSMVRGESTQNDDAHDILNSEVEDVYQHHHKLFHNSDSRPFGALVNLLTQTVNEITLRINRKPKAYLPCRAGNKILVVYDNGDVFPCEILEDRKIGNLRDFGLSLPKLLATSKAKDTVDWIIDTKCHCTWECANHTNVIYSKSWTAKLLARFSVDYLSRLFGGKGVKLLLPNRTK